jgi:hypothetical protein
VYNKFIWYVLLFTFTIPQIVVSGEDKYDIPEYIRISTWIFIGANPPSLLPDLFHYSGVKFCIKRNQDGTPYHDETPMLFVEHYEKHTPYPIDGMRHRFHAFYPDLKEGDIFPLPGAIYCYHQIKRGYRDTDAFRLDKDKFPDNIAPKKSNYFFPLRPDQKGERYLSGILRPHSFSVVEIKIEELTNKKMVRIAEYIRSNFELSEKTAKWYSEGDVISFSPASCVIPYSLYEGPDIGYRIVNIVPRDPYPIRSTGVMKGLKEMKGRVIGWIELDSTPIPLNEKGEIVLESEELMKKITDETKREEIKLKIEASEPKPVTKDFREWTSSNNKFSTDAVFVRVQDKDAVLKKRDDKEVTVPLEKLSDTDREYIQEQIKEQLAPKPEKPKTDSLP